MNIASSLNKQTTNAKLWMASIDLVSYIPYIKMQKHARGTSASHRLVGLNSNKLIVEKLKQNKQTLSIIKTN